MLGPPGPSLAVLLLLTAMGLRAEVTLGKGTCPAEQEVVPCRCQVRNSGGVDITCERVASNSVQQALKAIAKIKQTVVHLKIRHCTLGHLPADMFKDLQIKHLYILNSSLTGIHKDAFSPIAKSIETMELPHNKLTAVPEEALEPLSSIVAMGFSDNDIEELRAGAFKGLTSIGRLSINSNKIRRVDDKAFEGLENTITHINLANNELSTFPNQAFRILQNLTRLDVRENNISSIHRELFLGLHNINHISLHNNHIKNLPGKAFGNEIPLNALDLETNGLETIADDAFEGVEGTLEWLNLGGNNLTTVPTAALNRLVNLRELDLHLNGISTIPEGAFKGFKHLKSLNLKQNEIQQIPTMLFSSMQSLQWLYLGENKLQHIPMETYQHPLNNIISFDIHNNPLICDCELRWFREWLNLSGKMLTYPEDTRCVEPESLRLKALYKIPPDQFSCPMHKSPHNSGQSIKTQEPCTFCFFLLLLLLQISFMQQ